MRIGFDAKRAFHNYSGLGNYSRNIINQLYSLYPENKFYLYNPKKGKSINGFPPEEAFIRIPRARLYKMAPFLWRSFILPSVLKKDKIDIYHGLSNELPFGIRSFPGKKVVSIHDLIFLKYPHQYKKADRRIYNLKFSHSVREADMVIAISEQTKRDIVSYYGTDPSKIEVVYQDCASVYYSHELSEERKREINSRYDLPDEYILYVGTIEERKNLLSILKAVDQNKIDLPLVVAGRDTSYMKQVMDYIREKKMSNIFFFSYIVQEDLPEIYKNASVFVYPSSYEGFGIPVLEALNSGTPVITSRGSCLEETGGDAAIYVDPLNIDELGAAMIKVLEDSFLRSNMINKGRKHALNFRSEKTTGKLYELYRRLLD